MTVGGVSSELLIVPSQVDNTVTLELHVAR
jgi:hypothetical protein